MTLIARLLVRCAAFLVSRDDRQRWREEWLAEVSAASQRGSRSALRFAFGAPAAAWAMRPRRNILTSVGSDLRHAARQLIRRPAHTVAVVACLVVGLVASVATISLVTSFFDGDMPGIAGRRAVVRLYVGFDSKGGIEHRADGEIVVTEPGRMRALPFSADDFGVARALPPSSPLEGLAAEGGWRATVTGRHGPLAVSAAFASGDFFPLLRTKPVRGRLLSPSDDRPDGPLVAVVTDYYWRTQLDARDDAVGLPILVGGQPVTVVGIAPPQFHGLRFLDVTLDDSNGTQIWMPLSQTAVWSSVPPRNRPWLNIVGRLKPSRAAADAERDLSVTAARIAAADPDGRANAAIAVRPTGVGPNDSTADFAVIIAAMLALPLTILAIGCANVANLQLARVTEQSRELALRLALGATRARLLRLLTFETLGRVLAAAAASLAIVAAILARAQALFPVFLSIDWLAASSAILLAVAVSFATGLAPAWLVLRRTAAGQLKETAQTGGIAHTRLRASLVVVQVALSLTLFVLAGLFARTVEVMASAAPVALREQLVMSFDPSTLDMTPAQFSAFAEALARLSTREFDPSRSRSTRSCPGAAAANNRRE